MARTRQALHQQLQIKTLFVGHFVIKADLKTKQKPLNHRKKRKLPRRSPQLARQDVSQGQPPQPIAIHRYTSRSNLHVVPQKQLATVLELLPPGSFVTLENQPNDLPPFQLIQCKGGRCWVRQQAWGQHVHWEVEHRRLKSA
ncbi:MULTISPECIES: hypothetical protein [Prochlorococcus]|jgi:hypothetical protein|uniref:hypothetical protein n=1 Tax=Prochlorococcus TaxID=1218 RepID=UPI001E3819CE|nr:MULTISPECIES: hypothetical protein [Prochlorococcus]